MRDESSNPILRFALMLTCALAILNAPAFCAGEGEDEYNKGVRAYQQKDYKAAIDYFEQAIKKGNRTAEVWLYAGHTFLAMGKYQQAKDTYQTLIKNFKDNPAAQLAKDSMNVADLKLHPGDAQSSKKDQAGAGAKPGESKPEAKPVAKPALKNATGLLAKITITPPRMGHPAVSKQSIDAIIKGVEGLPANLRAKLDEFGASINVCPNMIDKWPESLNDLPEDNPEPTLAELPGRIYGREMFIYERPKARASTALKAARSVSEMRHTLYNCCTQLLDDAMNLSKDPALRAEYEADKANVPDAARDKLATFLKDDDWGPRETCSEIGAELLGQGDEFTSDLNRYFPRTKRWLRAKLGL